MNKEDFLLLTKNWKWSEASLKIVYDLFVNNETTKIVANKYNKLPQYINKYKYRFIEKKRKQQLEAFINNNELNQIKKYLSNEEKINISKDDLINRRGKK